VERQRIDAVLNEVSLGQSGVIDPESAAKAGKVLGAETVVTGAYQKMGETLRLTARFVKVETGIVSNTAMVTGDYNDIFSLEDDMADSILKNLGIEASASEKQKIAKNPTTSVAAYKSYTQGVSLMKKDHSMTQRPTWTRRSGRTRTSARQGRTWHSSIGRDRRPTRAFT
jgi:hypothetical protein